MTRVSSTGIGNFPDRLPEPENYLAGMDAPERPRVRSPLVFLRRTKDALQQRNFANRVHHRHVLLLVLETGGQVSLEGVPLRLEPGEGLLVLPYQFHHYIALDDTRLRWLFITFEMECGEAWCRGLGNLVLRPDESALRIWADIASLWKREGKQNERLMCLPRLEQLLLRLGGSAAGAPGNGGAGPGHPSSSWVARVEALLIESVERQRTVAEVAAAVGLSERQLRNRFAAAMGVGIRRYRANYQLHRAAALLRQEAMTITRTAGLCGFGSSAAFVRFIRRETGMTPKAWRRVLLQRETLPETGEKSSTRRP